MVHTTLHEFISVYRDELIQRCRAKVTSRSAPLATQTALEHGVPLFLDQLIRELRDGPSQTDEISAGAGRHGLDLLDQGFTVSEVVHCYGDVCQSVTDLAVEIGAPISTEDFRTLNRCLDDAIAAAVTNYSRAQELNSDGEAVEMRHLTQTAVIAFEVLKTGRVGVGGSTGAVLHRSLKALSTLLDRTTVRSGASD